MKDQKTQQRIRTVTKVILTIILIALYILYPDKIEAFTTALQQALIPQRTFIACGHTITIHGKFALIDGSPVKPEDILRDDRGDTYILDIIQQQDGSSTYRRTDLLLAADESGLTGCGLLEFTARGNTITSFHQRWENREEIIETITTHWGRLAPNSGHISLNTITPLNNQPREEGEIKITPFGYKENCQIAGFAIEGSQKRKTFILAGRFQWSGWGTWSRDSLTDSSPLPAPKGSIYASPATMTASTMSIKPVESSAVVLWHNDPREAFTMLTAGLIPPGVVIYDHICIQQDSPTIMTYSGYVISEDGRDIRPIYGQVSIRGDNR